MKQNALMALGLCMVMALPAYGGGEEQDRPQPASGPSLGDRMRGIFGSKAASAAAPAPALPQTEAGPRPAPAGASAGDGGLQVGKLKQFEKLSKTASTVIDGNCKNMVEPYSLTDSALSLIMLQIKLTTDNFMAEMSSSGTKPTDIAGTVRLAARQLNWLPMSVEVTMGEEMHRRRNNLLTRDKKSAQAYGRADQLLARALAQVKEPTPYAFKIFVVKRSSGNAEAAPGGLIYVDRDLVEKQSNEARAQLAVSHEVAHVLQRHETREIQARMADGIDSVSGLHKLISDVNGSPSAALIRARDLKRLFVQHSEQQEMQADACGLRILSTVYDAGLMRTAINDFIKNLPPTKSAPRVAQQTLEDLMKELGNGVFSSHPNTEDRVRNLKVVLAAINAGK